MLCPFLQFKFKLYFDYETFGLIMPVSLVMISVTGPEVQKCFKVCIPVSNHMNHVKILEFQDMILLMVCTEGGVTAVTRKSNCIVYTNSVPVKKLRYKIFMCKNSFQFNILLKTNSLHVPAKN